ncbi:uncharacterized protein N7496_006724 [Penicillium cataractarum]|uniref:DUF4604 domain-containing protein n=1 Tax=Penicillium cataractarum TaxID=2100454 RepID=A0A9W9V6K6_9EURO|nr:uncharacterized protein N7496_006724 [Penicillium cataractarum]KAJ5370632.1 hypothetical protein N7496_006724 [Penicillium cataractarum]
MSKNPKLAYEAKEPAFLQKLRGHYGDTSGRLERPAARPRKLKDKNEEDDDAPVYVDEESNEVLSKAEYEALVGGGSDQKDDETSAKDNPAGTGQDNAPSQTETSTAKQSNLTEVGGPRKRKQVKVVGEDEPEEKSEDKQEADEAKPKAPAPRKSKKAKKIKLSFDEE